MMKEVRLGCKIISFGFMILLDYLFIFKVTGLTEVHELYQLYELTLSAIVISRKSNAMLYRSANMILCRYLYQVTARSLYLLHKEAFEQ